MKRISLGAIYEVGLLAVLFLVVLHAPMTVWLGTIFADQQTIIKAWKEIVLAGLAVIAVVLITKRKLWQQIIHSSVILLTLAYADVYLVLSLLMGGDGRQVVAGLMIDLRFVLMFVLMYVLILLRPGALKRTLIVAAAGAGAVIGFGLLQITVLPDDILARIGYVKNETIAPYITIDSNPDYVRINSTTRGPNPLGAVMVIYVSLALAYLLQKYRVIDVRRRATVIAGIVAIVAVLFASYSRSAYLALVAVLGVLLLSGKRLNKRLLIVGAITGVWLVGLLLLTTQSDWFSNVILHEDPESTVVSKSNDGHMESLRVGWERMVTEPLGHGVGSTGSASLYDPNPTNDIIIENYYFFVAHEAGWLGLLLFMALFGYVLWLLWQAPKSWVAKGLFASGVGLALIGILLPVWTDDTVALLWWGLAGAVLASTSGIIEGGHAKRARK